MHFLVLCRYEYDAWGNHKVYNASGSEIGAEVANIGNVNPIRYAFSGCTSLTSVTIPDSVTSIGGSAINSERDFRKTQQKISNNIENSLQMIA